MPPVERYIEEELKRRWSLYFYIQNLRYHNKNRKVWITVCDTINTRASSGVAQR